MDLTGDREMNEVETLREMLGEPEKRQGERDARWRSVRNEHLRTHSFCIACGNTDSLEVHHIKPFVQNPELELDPDNLVTLCTCSSRGKMNCHLIMGHNGSMQEHNPNVVHDSIQMLKRINRDAYNEICKRFAGLATNALRCGDESIANCRYDRHGMSLNTAEMLIDSGVPFRISSEQLDLAIRAGECAARLRENLERLESGLKSQLKANLSSDEIREISIILASGKWISRCSLLSPNHKKVIPEQNQMIRTREAMHFHHKTRPTREQGGTMNYSLMPHAVDEQFNTICVF